MKLDKSLLMSAVLTACTAFVAPAQATEFRSADTHNADDYPTVAAVKYMSELLEKKSGGKHKIKVFNKQALGSEKETIDQVKIGALDFTPRQCRPDERDLPADAGAHHAVSVQLDHAHAQVAGRPGG